MTGITKEERSRCEASLSAARRVALARRKEQDFACDQIELLIYSAKERETVDTLVGLAQTILWPRRD